MGVMQASRVAVSPDEGGGLAQPLLAAAGPLPPLMLPAAPGTAVPRDPLGRLVFGLLHTMGVPGGLEDLQRPRVAGLVRQLRQRVTIALCCTLLTAPIALWLLVRGISFYISTNRTECDGPLRIWLLGFLMLQLAWPICMPSLTLLLLGWCLGALFLLHQQRRCEQLHEFLIEGTTLQSLQATLLLLAAIAALTARPLVQRLSDLLSYDGTDPEVVNDIMVLAPGEVPTDEECVVCLSTDDERWLQLLCGHRFHEPCLREWLGKARRCPVCRLDLHDAYGRPSSPLDAADEADIAVV